MRPSKLEVVLQLRRREERRALQRFGTAHRDLLAREASLRKAREDLERSALATLLSPGARQSAGALARTSHTRRALRMRERGLAGEVAQAQEKRAAARSAFEASRGRSRAIEHALERRLARERRRRLRRETLRLDDASRFARAVEESDAEA